MQTSEIRRAADWGDARRIEPIKNALRAFDRRALQDPLFKCHAILRDVHVIVPGRAFGAISKILFVKMWVERSGLHGTFTVNCFDRRAFTRLPTDPVVHAGLFEQTKDRYEPDGLFAETDSVKLSDQNSWRIARDLERFDFSKTGDGIKGLAFERFPGTTFRGEHGQFFMPRPIVGFMVDLLDPRGGDLNCDPAAGSSGFLIRAFEHAREHIAADVQPDTPAPRSGCN